MNNKKILVTIKKNGVINLETENYKGESCINDIKKLFNQFLDIETNLNLKSDYYENEEEILGGVDIKL